MKSTLLSLGMLLLISISTIAQDVILKTNDEMIKCKIKEIGLDEVKYVLPNYPQDVLFSLDRDKISKIVFENGEELLFQKEMTNKSNYEDNRKNILKIEFLSPLTGSTTFAFEHSLKPGKSIEATLGLVGMGIDAYDENQGGAFVKFGYKFIKDPDFYLRGMKYAHVLKGSYVKPEVSLGLVSRNVHLYDNGIDVNGYWYYNEWEERVTTFAGAIQVVLGKQWVFDNIFALDIHGGVGYGFYSDSNLDNQYYDDPYHHGFLVASHEAPISFSIGMKLGILLH